MQPKKDKRVVVRVEAVLYDLLNEMSLKGDRTISAVIRQIIKKHFGVK
jgi:predicted DNA-binding protein